MTLLVGAATKLAYELAALRHLGDRHHSVGKRIALLSLGELGSFTKARFACGALGALVLPALGLVAALGVSRLLGSVLFGVSATDGPSFARALAIVLAGVVVATLVPACRASRTSPLRALRHQ